MSTLHNRLDELVNAAITRETHKGSVNRVRHQLKAALSQLIVEQQRDLICIAKERLEDKTYTLDAWVQDAEEYLNRVALQSTVKGES